ncbi:uncharacterized protein LOC141589885 [Silene latifolia]|uniref:uncharacterized protein LOC141589885 n=1 Tax=Silene latifolia TaxID=37657 RepID=UPI003D78B06A
MANLHRFYGQSVPLGSIDVAMMDPYVRVLAAWFRIKYPNIVDGALASSAPVFDSEDLAPENEYCSIVSRDFKDINEKCYDYIAKSWKLMDEVASEPGGIDNLSLTFSSCGELTMFEKKSFNLSTFKEDCFEKYGVYPHDKWISTYYGVQDLKTSLKKSASNIIFSNGLLDPFSGASILEDISKTVVAITTKQGSHCLDLGPPHDDDPKWLKHQREKELKIIGYWIKTADSSSNQVPGLGIWLVLVSVYFIIVYG